MKIKFLLRLLFLPVLLTVGFKITDLDEAMHHVIIKHKLEPYQEISVQDSARVELGRMLFFDRLLSGNRDVSCATCHHPSLKSGDNLPLAIGVGGTGLGEARIMGEGRERIPRNSPEIFNRGSEKWHTMFWDGRVSGSAEAGFVTPADEKLPEGLENILAAQAMFPVTSRDEMRGEIGDVDINGKTNELSLISDAAPQSVWMALMRRILAYPEYVALFEKAYPDLALKDLGFQHAANAIAAFEISEFTFVESPWDQYLNGNLEAMSNSAKRGALLFYGKANCVACHQGVLFTDQKFHNIGIPQFGPGKDNAAPLDAGRFLETGDPKDRFAFRTPPLRNVALTGPWMHNGSYVKLADAIIHHLYPDSALRNYDINQLAPELRNSYKDDAAVLNKILSNLDSLVVEPPKLTENELRDLISFMEALSDPKSLELETSIPRHVPSRLPVEVTTSNHQN